ncbi:MAG: T9SS type A sorting domain-containing protein [Flavobacteriales bacterium]|nr:T9SS type A sorting domain-containing protein [Flavobacteriales bacterium]
MQMSPVGETRIATAGTTTFAEVSDSVNYDLDTTAMSDQTVTLYSRETDVVVPTLDHIEGYWFGQSNKYLFVKITDQIRLIDAWIKMSSDSADCISITDYYYTYTGYVDVGSVEKPKANIYPNPVQNTVTVKANTPLTQVWLTDLAGRRLQSLQRDSFNRWQTDLSSLPTGMYLIEAYTINGKPQISKVVKE